MNAPFAWPTKYPLPQFRTKRVAVVGLGVLLASCSDGLTSPSERAPASALPPATGSPVFTAPDVVVMERTTTDAASDGEIPVVHTSREVLTPQVRIASKGPRAGTLSATSATAPQGLPRPPLFLPARREVAICNALPTWTDVTKGANGRDILVSGVGDAPASTMKIPQADGSYWTVERTWTRTATSWQLDRQVTKGARGYTDIVTYHHQDALGKAVNNAVPVSACTGQQHLVGPASAAASRTFYPAYSGALYSRLVPGSGVTADDGCLGSDGDACYDKRVSVYKSDIALVAAATAVTLACVTPLNVVVVTCLGATSLYVGAIANLVLDQAALQRCLEDAKPKLPELSVAIGAGTSVVGSPASAVRGTGGSGSKVLAMCGTGVFDGNASGLHCRWDVYEISYDGGHTWMLLATFLICDNAM